MKRMVIVAIAVCGLVLMMAGVAFAEGYGTGSYGTTADDTLTWSTVSGSNLIVPEGSPHGGFEETSHNCQACHSVHNAAGGGEALLPNTVDNACIYCHVEPGDAGYIELYGGASANYTNASDNGHDTAGAAACVNCHQVHAAATQMVSAAAYGTGGTTDADLAFLTEKLLKVDGSGTDLNDPDGNDLKFAATDSEDVMVSKWCTACHTYYTTARDKTSHVMGPATDDYTSDSGNTGLIGTISTSGSEDCRKCHSRGAVKQTPAPPATVSTANNFPHFTDGVRFLSNYGSTAGATDAHADGVCLNCHQGNGLGDAGAASSGGVGINF